MKKKPIVSHDTRIRINDSDVYEEIQRVMKEDNVSCNAVVNELLKKAINISNPEYNVNDEILNAIYDVTEQQDIMFRKINYNKSLVDIQLESIIKMNSIILRLLSGFIFASNTKNVPDIPSKNIEFTALLVKANEGKFDKIPRIEQEAIDKVNRLNNKKQYKENKDS